MEDKIVTIEAKKDEKFLRKKTQKFDFKKYTRKEINDLIIRMRKAMKKARGIGLSANQIGLDISVFVAQIQKNENDERSLTAGEQKFYAIFNPEIIKASKEKTMLEEGCLSVPYTYAEVERPEKVTLVGFDKSGKEVKIKAWGMLAKVFQHETDHLNGKIILDRAKKIYKVPTSDRLKDREKDIEE